MKRSRAAHKKWFEIQDAEKLNKIYKIPRRDGATVKKL